MNRFIPIVALIICIAPEDCYAQLEDVRRAPLISQVGGSMESGTGPVFVWPTLDRREAPELPPPGFRVAPTPPPHVSFLNSECGEPVRNCDLAAAITIEPVYIGEVFTNTRGGISTRGATQYEGLLDLLFTADLEKTRIPLPGSFVVLAQNTHGRGLTDDFIGDTQFISNIDSSDNIMQVSEYWWEFGLLDDNITVRLGKQDLNREFLVMEMAEDFIQSSFGLSPSSAGLPTYPDSSMGAVVVGQLTDSRGLKLGIWDALANGGGWGFSGNDIVLLIAELECKYSLYGSGFPGVVDFGIGYNNEGVVDGKLNPSDWGYYIQLEQLIYRERLCEPGDSQGLGLFASYLPRFGQKTAATRETIKDSATAGVVYAGLIPERDDDVVGIGVAWARLSRGGTGQETVIEAFYKAHVNSSMSIQPDVQYIASPSGTRPDALAVGVRFQLK